MTITLHNTLTRRKDELKPLNEKNVRMYVCGPTVYDRPHLGNARSVVVYDVLYRLLCQQYGKEHVTYARNITDVDDKINAAAKANDEPIFALTTRVEGWFHADIAALNCLPPTIEPRATAHIPQMIAMIEKLIAHGNAYASEGHVLFAVESYKDYGQLSGRKLEDLIAGARIEVESYKRHPGDFVLWKPADEGDDASSVFDSPWGKGRPGWHIECSAMSGQYLGEHFDIHGGGADLMFPHHENEIAQSCCASPGSKFANLWVHNGFLTVNGEKMSKSLGNFITVKDLLDQRASRDNPVAIQKWGEIIRLALLMTKYSEPLDWSEKLLSDAKKALDGWYRTLKSSPLEGESGVGGSGVVNAAANYSTAFTTPLPHPSPTRGEGEENHSPPQGEREFVDALSDDLNTPKAIALMHSAKPEELAAMGNLLGLLQKSPEEWFKGEGDAVFHSQASLSAESASIISKQGVDELVEKRRLAKLNKNWAEADKIRNDLSSFNIILEDKPDGTTDWRRA
ncbi:MAG: cysteine--tRNA ligase [Alphaproteobacteria bacterium]|nr:cysteine--tRNA ligase [Alphaproteobacteria bacterium]